jgi:membrane associated rhomboid family serine protease
MFPISDLNPTRRMPIMTYILIGINVLVFVWQLTLSPEQLNEVFRQFAAVPANFNGNLFGIENLLDSVRSMFMHGGFEHIIGNMLYLWLFGDNIEDRFGIPLYLALYFITGFAAVYAQVLIDINSPIPMIGASGAVAGILGAYLILYPTVKVRGIVGIGAFGMMQEWPAVIVLGMWFALQLFSGFASLGADAAYGGVAFFAHIGGFVVGAILGFIFGRMVPQGALPERQAAVYERYGRPRIR